MNDILKIRNVFGITPTNTHQSAGMDFYIPNINPDEHDLVTIKDAFVKSYNIDVDEYLNCLCNITFLRKIQLQTIQCKI